MDATQAAHAQETTVHVSAQYSTSHQSGLKHLDSTFPLTGGQQLTNRGCVLLSRKRFQLPELLCPIPCTVSDWGSTAVKRRGRKRKASFQKNTKSGKSKKRMTDDQMQSGQLGG